MSPSSKTDKINSERGRASRPEANNNNNNRSNNDNNRRQKQSKNQKSTTHQESSAGRRTVPRRAIPWSPKGCRLAAGASRRTRR